MEDNLEVQTEQPKLEELARAYQAQTLAVSRCESVLATHQAALSAAKEGQAAARKAYLAAAINLPSA